MWYVNIPKILYVYWGEEKLSWLRYLTVKTFSKFNPGWKIKYYYPKKLQVKEKPWDISKHKTKLDCIDWFEKLKTIKNVETIKFDFEKIGFKNDLPEVYKSDVLRLYLLSEFGGIWSDIDIIYFKSMNEAYFNCVWNKKINTIICHNGYHYSIGFLGANKGNMFYADLLEKARHHADHFDYQRYGTILWEAHYRNEKSIRANFGELNFHNLRMELVYPFRYNQNILILTKNCRCKHEDTIGLHWFAGHEDATNWENVLTPQTFYKYETTITNAIKRAL